MAPDFNAPLDDLKERTWSETPAGHAGIPVARERRRAMSHGDRCWPIRRMELFLSTATLWEMTGLRVSYETAGVLFQVAGMQNIDVPHILEEGRQEGRQRRASAPSSKSWSRQGRRFSAPHRAVEAATAVGNHRPQANGSTA